MRGRPRHTGPPAHFPWAEVQEAFDRADAVVYRHAVAAAREEFLSQARPCPDCGRPPERLAWVCISTPEPTWQAGTGRTGWLTLCEACGVQVDFIADAELSALDAEVRAAVAPPGRS